MLDKSLDDIIKERGSDKKRGGGRGGGRGSGRGEKQAAGRGARGRGGRGPGVSIARNARPIAKPVRGLPARRQQVVCLRQALHSMHVVPLRSKIPPV